MRPATNTSRKQLVIFLVVCFGLCFAMGVPLGLAHARGLETGAFPIAQMLYPAAGVMLAALVTRRDDAMLPRRFFVGFLVLTGLTALCALGSLFLPIRSYYVSVLIAAGSVFLWIFLLTEDRAHRAAYGLLGGHWRQGALICLLFLLLTFASIFVLYALAGETGAWLDELRSADTWRTLLLLAPSFFLQFPLFLGEEYGWRCYLQPILQRRLGVVRGVLVLGLVWGLWHLPLSLFYYSDLSSGLLQLAGQITLCVSIGVFFGWAYMRTGNIWIIAALHFINNGVFTVLAGAESVTGQQFTWRSVLVVAARSVPLFMGFLLARCYRRGAAVLPTLEARAAAARPGP